MARLPRFDLADHLHLALLRGRSGAGPVFVDDEDRRRFAMALLDSSRESGVALHAYVLMDDGVMLLATPAAAMGLARCVQAVGRRYVKAFNHRHGRSGPLWEGRYRATLIDAPSRLLEATRLVEQAPVRAGLVQRADEWPWSSAAHHAGLRVDPLVAEHETYWQLGNTPFEREARHVRDNAQLLGDAEVRQWLDAVRLGWPVGPELFLHAVGAASGRPVRPRAKGRRPKPGVGATRERQFI